MAILWVHRIMYLRWHCCCVARVSGHCQNCIYLPTLHSHQHQGPFIVISFILRSDFTHVGQVAEVATENRMRGSPLHHPPPASTAKRLLRGGDGRGGRGRKSPLLLFSLRLFPGGCCCCVELLRCRGHGGARVVTGVVGGGTKGITRRTDGQTEVERARRFPLQMQLLAATRRRRGRLRSAEESPCRAQKG